MPKFQILRLSDCFDIGVHCACNYLQIHWARLLLLDLRCRCSGHHIPKLGKGRQPDLILHLSVSIGISWLGATSLDLKMEKRLKCLPFFSSVLQPSGQVDYWVQIINPLPNHQEPQQQLCSAACRSTLLCYISLNIWLPKFPLLNDQALLKYSQPTPCLDLPP